MEALEALQRRIHSVGELADITRAMKTLAAVAIRQYENAATSLDDYYATVEMGLSAMITDRARHAALLAEEAPPPAGPPGLVVFGSDTGLCGRFNEEIAGHALELATENGGARLLVVGERLCALLADGGRPGEACLHAPGAVAGIAPLTQELLLRMLAWREQGLRHLVLLHNRQQRGEAYAPQRLELLPLDLARFAHLERRAWTSRSLPYHTMEAAALFAALVRQYLFVSVFRACAHSLASENAARLHAMQAAEHNIGERREALEAAYRQARQNAITEELLDVVAGFEVLTGKTPGQEAGTTGR